MLSTPNLRPVLLATLALAASLAAHPAFSGQTYNPCDDALSAQTVTLTGHDLTIEQIVAVARHGAKVKLSPEAQQRAADNYGLLLEATAEGVSVYWFNRGTGDNRETVLFSGDATSAENKPTVEKIQLESFRRGAHAGYGPEIMDEDIIRAMMVVRANEMTHNAPSPQLSQMLLDLLNDRITPVVQSRGTVGEGDLAQLSNVAATMVGAGEAYFRGTRMPAAEALKKAGLSPIRPFAADENALTSSDAYATGQAALVVYDARHALEWADLVYAMSLDGMNSSITPLSTVVQRDRPELERILTEERTQRSLLQSQPHHYPSGDMTGFSDKVSDFDFTFEDTKHGLGVEETSDSPIAKLFFWSTPKTVCPEGFIAIHVLPGQTQKWSIHYRFFTSIPPAAKTALASSH